MTLSSVRLLVLIAQPSVMSNYDKGRRANSEVLKTADDSNPIEREWDESKEIRRIAPCAATKEITTSPDEQFLLGTSARDAMRSLLSVGYIEKRRILYFIGLVAAETPLSFHS